jgi:EAL domain-containing protein (putative c-di-GMP-specific phosphodiesterase class I)
MECRMTAVTDAVPRDRLLGFAFAAADLLVEASEDGAITFATGAFRQRFSAAPEEFVGRRVGVLILREDRPALDVALASTSQRGRAPAQVLRLNDGQRTPVSVGVMRMPGPPARLCVTFGQVPLALPAGEAPPAPLAARGFTREVAAHVREGGGGALALIDLPGWEAARGKLDGEERQAIGREIGSALTQGTLAGKLGEGRYGLVAQAAAEVSAIVDHVASVLAKSPRAGGIRPQQASLALTGAAQGEDAARAARFALAQFETGGMEAAREAGIERGMATLLAKAAAQAGALRGALVGRNLRLVYQPVVDLGARRVHHYEALLNAIGMPGAPTRDAEAFARYVEAVGLTEDLDAALAGEALIALRGAPGASVAINVSSHSIQAPGFAARLLDMLARAEIAQSSSAPRLLVELNEAAAIEDVGEAATALAMLRAAGVPVCLDDFDAGAKALHCLRDVPVDYVKIDGSQVLGAERGGRDDAMVASMVGLAVGAGARTVAERLQTEEHAVRMRDLGVQYGQGNLFGAPGHLPGTAHR